MTESIRVEDVSDVQLMALLRRQNAEALAVLYDRHHRAAFSLAYRIVNETGHAEDVVQEAFLLIWRQATSYQPERGQPRPWLLAIVRNQALNFLRRGRSGREMTDPLAEHVVDTRQPEVWKIAFDSIRHAEIVEALSALPAEQRVAVELAFFGGLSYAEIAERLSVPLGTIKSRIRLAFRRLEPVLAVYAEEPRQ